jgi:hypothetical protein
VLTERLLGDGFMAKPAWAGYVEKNKILVWHVLSSQS